MPTNPGDGIYRSRANWYKQTSWPNDRNVYIQGTVVRLVDDPLYTYDFDHFFEANDLGERIADLPEGFDIKVTGR